MTGSLSLALLLLGALASLGIWWLYREASKQATIRAQWVQELRARDEARCQAIEADLQEWLKMLELPALEEQTRLAAAARRLRIVLVERLVSGPRIR